MDLLKLWITLPKIYDKNRRKVQDKINTLGLDLKLDIKNAKKFAKNQFVIYFASRLEKQE